MKELTEEQKSQITMARDAIYHALVAKAGLYGKAFFAHKKSKQESAKIRRLQQSAERLARESVLGSSGS